MSIPLLHVSSCTTGFNIIIFSILCVYCRWMEDFARKCEPNTTCTCTILCNILTIVQWLYLAFSNQALSSSVNAFSHLDIKSFNTLTSSYAVYMHYIGGQVYSEQRGPPDCPPANPDPGPSRWCFLFCPLWEGICISLLPGDPAGRTRWVSNHVSSLHPTFQSMQETFSCQVFNSYEK